MVHLRQLPGRLLPLLFLLPAVFLLLFFFYPLTNILWLGFFGEPLLVEGGAGVTIPVGRIFAFTLWQAALSTALTLLAGLPAAYLFATYDFPGRRLLRALATVPFVLPTVVVAAAFRALLGPGGPVNGLLMRWLGLPAPPLDLEQSLALVLLAHVFYNLAIVIRLVGGFWANLSPRLEEAARVLGGGRWRVFWSVTLPLLRPALLGASLLVFLFTFTSFGVILILGGSGLRTLETEIYRQFVRNLRPDLAALLSLIQIVFTFILMSLYARWQERSALPLDLQPGTLRRGRPVSRRARLAVGLLLGGLLLFMLAPLLALVWRSLGGETGQFSLRYYQALAAAGGGRVRFVPPLLALRNSLGYALSTVGAAALLGLLAATALRRAGRGRRWLDALLMLPLGASAVTLGFGYVTSYSQLRTSPWLVLIAHTLVAMPFVVRSLLPVMQGIQPAWREAAAVLGAAPGQVWRLIDLPIVGRALLVGAVFAFTVSMGEFGATSFIARPDSGFTTVPLVIEQYLRPGSLNFGQALALSTILMGVCTAGFMAIERFRYADIGEF